MSRLFNTLSRKETPRFSALVTETPEEKIEALKAALTYLLTLDKSPAFKTKANSVLVFLNSDTATPSHFEYPEIKLRSALLALSNKQGGHKSLIDLAAFFEKRGNIALGEASMKEIAGLSDKENTFAPHR